MTFVTRGGTWRTARVARLEWPSLAVLVSASLIAGFGWGWKTRPMGDSGSYRQAARIIFGGWHQLTDRTPGYPFLLWITGSTHGETHLLFVVQLALHMITVFVVVRLANRAGVPAPGRVAIAILLVLPPEMVLVVSSGSEALAQFLLVVAFWAVVRWCSDRRAELLVIGGLAFGLLGWVTPAMAFLALPVAGMVAIVLRRSGQQWWRASTVVLPAMALVVVLLVVNAVRFDSPDLTPLTGWYLGSRTSLYVQRLPSTYEPARSILIAERNRELLEGDAVDAPNYSFAVRTRLARKLHMTSRQLDDYMLRLNLRLIVSHPLEYVTAVSQSIPRYVDVDSEPGVAVLGRVSAWIMQAIHMVLALVFFGVAAVVAGLAWTRRLRPRDAVIWAFGSAVAAYGLLSATMLETGTVRLRVPFDPILVLMLVSGCYVAANARPPRPRTISEGVEV